MSEYIHTDVEVGLDRIIEEEGTDDEYEEGVNDAGVCKSESGSRGKKRKRCEGEKERGNDEQLTKSMVIYGYDTTRGIIQVTHPSTVVMPTRKCSEKESVDKLLVEETMVNMNRSEDIPSQIRIASNTSILSPGVSEAQKGVWKFDVLDGIKRVRHIRERSRNAMSLLRVRWVMRKDGQPMNLWERHVMKMRTNATTAMGVIRTVPPHWLSVVRSIMDFSPIFYTQYGVSFHDVCVSDITRELLTLQLLPMQSVGNYARYARVTRMLMRMPMLWDVLLRVFREYDGDDCRDGGTSRNEEKERKRTHLCRRGLRTSGVGLGHLDDRRLRCASEHDAVIMVKCILSLVQADREETKKKTTTGTTELKRRPFSAKKCYGILADTLKMLHVIHDRFEGPFADEGNREDSFSKLLDKPLSGVSRTGDHNGVDADMNMVEALISNQETTRMELIALTDITYRPIGAVSRNELSEGQKRLLHKLERHMQSVQSGEHKEFMSCGADTVNGGLRRDTNVDEVESSLPDLETSFGHQEDLKRSKVVVMEPKMSEVNTPTAPEVMNVRTELECRMEKNLVPLRLRLSQKNVKESKSSNIKVYPGTCVDEECNGTEAYDVFDDRVSPTLPEGAELLPRPSSVPFCVLAVEETTGDCVYSTEILCKPCDSRLWRPWFATYACLETPTDEKGEGPGHRYIEYIEREGRKGGCTYSRTLCREVLRSAGIPRDHRANVFMSDKMVQYMRKMAWRGAARNHWMQQGVFPDFPKRKEVNENEQSHAALTMAAAAAYFAEKRAEVVNRGYAILTNMASLQEIYHGEHDARKGIHLIDKGCECDVCVPRYSSRDTFATFHELFDWVQKSFRGGSFLSEKAGKRVNGPLLWNAIINSGDEERDRTEGESGKGRFTSTTALLVDRMEKKDVVWTAKRRALLDMWLGILMAMMDLTEWETCDKTSVRLWMPKSGGRFLITGKGALPQVGHNDFMARENQCPGFFVLVTAEETELYVCPGSHLFVFYDVSVLRRLAKDLRMTKVKIDANSVFIGHGFVQHAGAGWSGSYCLRYHTYFVPDGYKLPDGVHFAYDGALQRDDEDGIQLEDGANVDEDWEIEEVQYESEESEGCGNVEEK